MIRSQLEQIEVRRARLVERAAAERASLGAYFGRAAGVSSWFKDRSLVFGGAAAVLAVAVGPKRLLGLATSAWSVWRVYAGLRKLRL